MGDPAVWRIGASEAEAAQRRAAASLRRLGLVAGERVVVSVPTSPDVLALVIGALRCGIVPVVLNPSLLPEERRSLADDADAALVVDTPAAVAELVSADGDERDLAPHPLARPMHYTSGTTGRPKGVWSGVLSERDAEALFLDERDLWSFTADDVLLVCSPLHHSAPIRFSISALLSGADVVLVERFDSATVVDTIRHHRPTATFMVPSHLQRLFAAPPEQRDLSSFRLLAHAGEACPAALKHRAFDEFPEGAVWEFYGSTEGQFTVCGPAEWQARPSTVGRARPNRRVDVDDDGQIWCTVPAWARFEYWNDPDKTAEAWRGDAFTVGDLGRLDAEGYLFIDGRRDDLIISGGVNVYPAEIENVLSLVPGVREIAAFGAVDERWGERVCIAVIGDVDDQAIREAARSHLAPYKRPKDIYRIESLPRTGTGKIRRSVIARTLGLE
ncbi:MAG TPA: AMP-binding protein [Acidimicrobiales bacterium]|nr:AMP-binding protein [Acidimicrobiales bacterium]